MISCSMTDIGKSRQINQDYIFCENEPLGGLPNLYIVADGMGGHNAGDYASRYCVEAFTEQIKASRLATPVGILEEAIAKANEGLLREAEKKAEYDGMGTTMVAATVVDSILYVANVGDSRLYLLSEGSLRQVTEDHSLVEAMVRNGEIERTEARIHPNKNIITRALGAKFHVLPDFFEINIKMNDIIVMCSDGLSNMVEDDEIREIVTAGCDDLASSAEALIERANAYGGKDNIAIIIMKP